MKLRRPSPSLVISGLALFIALGGGGYALAASWTPTQHNVQQLISQSNSFVQSKHFVSSGGEHFLKIGQTVKLGTAGHFTFSSSCANPTGVTGAQQVTFDVTANIAAGLDGNPPVSKGHLQNIHTNSDALDSTTTTPLNAGDFDQVGSASSSTEIAKDGQEVDVFYNDGVNWPSVNGSKPHQCFAGFTGFLG